MEKISIYENNEILPFDGTVQGLSDQLELLKATMPKHPAFVCDRSGTIMNRVRVVSKPLTDGSYVWDIELFCE